VADIDEKVLAAVETAIKENPNATVDELMELAKGVSPSMGKLTKRQFHARYPLQVKRKMSAAKGGRRRTRKRTSGKRGNRAAKNGREAVRAAFLRFASDLAGAEARKDVIKVVANVDKYVDEVLRVTGTS